MASSTNSSISKSPSNSGFQWFLGLCMACCFSLVYFVAPFYILSSLVFTLYFYNTLWLWIYIAPIIISAIIPPIYIPKLISRLSPMLSYFDFTEIHETKPINVFDEVRTNKKNYLCIFQPHGVISYVGIMSAVYNAYQASLTSNNPTVRVIPPTAVASALLHTPILKHVLGIFGLISASKGSMQRTLKEKGVNGTIVLYVGGMAELFLSCHQEEKLYLLKRKGFIKLALQEGIDVVPVYLFGNTTVLSVLKTKFLATLSRKYGISLTYFWGKYYLPIPRDCQMLYVSGQPLGMPRIDHPTQEDIDHWHAKYCAEVTRLFNTYKERVPDYKHKTLEIV